MVLMNKIVVILDNIRSAHNVGSIFRSADGFGIDSLILCGITPYPQKKGKDDRLPHIARNAEKMIQKTALGAEKSVTWFYSKSTIHAISECRKNGMTIVSLEQSADSISLDRLKSLTNSHNIAMIVGPEVSGISKEIIDYSDYVIEIPMKGKKESLNVSVAAAIAMYGLTKA